MGEAYIIFQACLNILTCTPLGSSKMVKKDQKGKPKRGLSAYFCFMREERPKVMKAKPNLKIGDVTKILAAKWNKLDYEEDKERYLREMEDWEAKQASAAKAAAKKGKKDES